MGGNAGCKISFHSRRACWNAIQIYSGCASRLLKNTRLASSFARAIIVIAERKALL